MRLRYFSFFPVVLSPWFLFLYLAWGGGRVISWEIAREVLGDSWQVTDLQKDDGQGVERKMGQDMNQVREGKKKVRYR